MYFLVLLCFLSIGPHTAVSQAQHASESIVARAGVVFISEREFIDRFELTPGLNRTPKSALEEEKESFLYSLIAEKLLAQEARERRFDRDSVFRENINSVSRLLARDELYRQEIRTKVAVTEEDLNIGTNRAKRELLLRYIYFQDEATARFVAMNLKRAADLRSFQLDSTMSAIVDTATLLWGDADVAIEEAAYQLDSGKVSPVIPSNDGFYILALAGARMNPRYSSMSLVAVRERVESRIRQRKERHAMQQYLSTFMSGRKGYSSSTTFHRFAADVTNVLQYFRQPRMSDSAHAMLEGRCSSYLSDTLIVAGSRTWSVRDVIGSFYQIELPSEVSNISAVSSMLYHEFQDWIGKELLEQEALSRGYDTLATIRQELNAWRDQALALMMKRYAESFVNVSDAELYSYLNSLDVHSPIPLVRIRELRTTSIEVIAAAVEMIQSGARFERTLDRWPADGKTILTSGLTDPFSIASRKPIGEIAWALNIGDLYGPVQDSSCFVLFELVEKIPIPLRSDSTSAEREIIARAELRRMKQRRHVDLFLAQLAAKSGYTIFRENLQLVRVISTPMLAFRYLGFGGRMFAVPFVSKQVDWITLEPPSEPIVP